MTGSKSGILGKRLWSIPAIALILGCATLYVLSRRIDGISLTVSGLSVFLIVWWFSYFFLDSDNLLTNPQIALITGRLASESAE